MDKNNIRSLTSSEHEPPWGYRFRKACNEDPLQAVYTVAFATSVGIQAVYLFSTALSGFASLRKKK